MVGRKKRVSNKSKLNTEVKKEEYLEVLTKLRLAVNKKKRQILYQVNNHEEELDSNAALSEIKLLQEEMRSVINELSLYVRKDDPDLIEQQHFIIEIDDFCAESGCKDAVQARPRPSRHRAESISSVSQRSVNLEHETHRSVASKQPKPPGFVSQRLAARLQMLEIENKLQQEELKLRSEREKTKLLREAIEDSNITDADLTTLFPHPGRVTIEELRSSDADVPSPQYGLDTMHPSSSCMISNQDVNLDDKIKVVTKPSPFPTKQSNLNKDIPFQPGTTSLNQNQSVPSEINPMVLLSKIQLLNSLVPFKFNGDCLGFPLFRSQIRTHLEDGILPESEKNVFLAKFLEGEALRVFQENFGLSYQDSVALLERRFGNSVAVTEAWIRKLTEGPLISINDDKKLLEFGEALRTATRVLSPASLREISCKMSLKKMVSRLPSSFLPAWVTFVEKLDGDESIEDLAKFVEEQARIRNHPVYYKSTSNFSKNCPTFDSNNVGIKRDYVSRSINHKDKEMNEYSKQQFRPTSNFTVCEFCKGTHSLTECFKLSKKSPEEIREFVRQGERCFGCLKKGHLSKFCTKRAICNVRDCKKNHPSAIHSLNPIIRENANTIDNRSKELLPSSSSMSYARQSFGDPPQKTTSFIIPVYIHHRHNPKNRKLVYALLDDGSDTCFVTDSLRKSLRQTGIITQLELSTIHQKSKEFSRKLTDLIVTSFDKKVTFELPPAYSRHYIPGSPDEIPTPDIAKHFPHLYSLVNEIHPLLKNSEISILIGNNCPRALCPIKVLSGEEREPYAVKTSLGWGIIGPKPYLKKERVNTAISRLSVKEIINIFYLEPPSKNLIDYHTSLSLNDKKFINIIEEGVIQRPDNHYEIPLPIKNNNFKFPLNKEIAVHRLNSLVNKFKNPTFKRDYVVFMNDMIEKGHAEVASVGDIKEGKVWYLPHHGVYHPRKKDKIRVVFDCSAVYKGVSLNTNLISSPDLTNSVVGVLMRFRQEKVAFVGDIEAMFLQVYVPEKDRNLLRFLWWEEGDVLTKPKEYRMTKHLFGASSSPGCANYALRKTADDHGRKFSERAAQFVRRNFYMDDGCGSVGSDKEAIELIRELQQLCHAGGFRFHKLLSSSPEVVKLISKEERASGLKEFEVDKSLPMERTLGIAWCVESDQFLFKVQVPPKPWTRRGMLSTLCSAYDPLGFLAPFIMTGKIILQELTRDSIVKKIDWDDSVPEYIALRWGRWLTDLGSFSKVEFSVPRCYKPIDMEHATRIEMHHFADASNFGYGHVTYLRFLYENKVHCSFLFGKARVRPIRELTIPRLELTAAVSVSLASETFTRELDYPVTRIFWTDSKVVLGYIKNETKRFRMYVANRVQTIRDCSDPTSWYYVQSTLNPADLASRGLSAEEFRKSLWLTGPKFLHDNTLHLENCYESEMFCINDSDPEVKQATVRELISTEDLERKFSEWSSWSRLTRAYALAFRYIAILKAKALGGKNHLDKATNPLEPLELREAQNHIVKETQNMFFKEELILLQKAALAEDYKCRQLKKDSKLRSLNPWIDSNRVIRVGGRIEQIEDYEAHPVIIPNKSHIATLLIRHFHEKVMHQGRGITLNEIRTNGFWIIGGPSIVARYIYNCVTCRKLRGKTCIQKMANLPPERLSPSPPFTYSSADVFGPYYVKQSRSKIKRYGIIFTCLVSRAVHLDVLDTLDTNSFLNSLRRFLCHRGEIKLLRTDAGTNFIGGKEEIRLAKIQRFLAEKQCTFEFHITTPKASHKQGAVERQILTVRRILDFLLGINKERGKLTDDCLRTFLAECEAIINSRPLTVENIYDSELKPLTPNHLLLLKEPVLPDPRDLPEEIYARKRWRRVQALAQTFWARWKNEYLSSLQQRIKWQTPKRNLQLNDIVLCSKENEPRPSWPLARVIQAEPDDDGYVRTIRLRFAGGRELNRPSTSVILLVSASSME